jgi:hypothetical protein
MKIWKALGLGAIGVSIAAFALSANGDKAVTMHEQDWEDGMTPVHGRRYRSFAQFLHHQREMSRMLWPAAQIYILRAMDPAFREQIMILTAMSNACSP